MARPVGEGANRDNDERRQSAQRQRAHSKQDRVATTGGQSSDAAAQRRGNRLFRRFVATGERLDDLVDLVSERRSRRGALRGLKVREDASVTIRPSPGRTRLILHS